MKFLRILLTLFILLKADVFAQKISVQQYIDMYKELAIAEMKRSGVPADITLAQGVLETENGNSDLVKRSNNHFGIKCKETWTGETVYHDDDEKGECFRKYNDAVDSYRDHSEFLRKRPNYTSLFTLDPTDYKAWAYGLKKAGYATNPNYPKILIKTIEEYKLNQLSIEVVKSKDLNLDTSIHNNSYNNSLVRKTLDKINSIFQTKNPALSKFNGLNAIYTDSGVSLLAIATNFDIPLSDLLQNNDLETDGLLREKQWIFLEKKPREGKTDFYTTTAFETVYDIAQLNAIQLSALLEYNGLIPMSVVKPRTKLYLRKKLDNTVLFENQRTQKHLVKPKEGLYSISKMYSVSVEDLKKMNNLQSNELSIGQELIISK